jgi:hypothetical protein
MIALSDEIATESIAVYYLRNVKGRESFGDEVKYALWCVLYLAFYVSLQFFEFTECVRGYNILLSEHDWIVDIAGFGYAHEIPSEVARIHRLGRSVDEHKHKLLARLFIYECGGIVYPDLRLVGVYL